MDSKNIGQVFFSLVFFLRFVQKTIMFRNRCCCRRGSDLNGQKEMVWNIRKLILTQQTESNLKILWRAKCKSPWKGMLGFFWHLSTLDTANWMWKQFNDTEGQKSKSPWKGTLGFFGHLSTLFNSGRKKGRKCFILQCTQHILFTVIWCQTYGKGPFK